MAAGLPHERGKLLSPQRQLPIEEGTASKGDVRRCHRQTAKSEFVWICERNVMSQKFASIFQRNKNRVDWSKFIVPRFKNV